MGKKFNLQDARKSVVMQEQLGVASDYLDRKYDQKYPTLWKRYVMDRLTRDSKEEELRILYVAMTRAKEKLILTGVEKDPEAKMRKEERMLTFEPSARLPEWYVASANSYLDWLFMSLARDRGNYTVSDSSAGCRRRDWTTVKIFADPGISESDESRRSSGCELPPGMEDLEGFSLFLARSHPYEGYGICLRTEGEGQEKDTSGRSGRRKRDSSPAAVHGRRTVRDR